MSRTLISYIEVITRKMTWVGPTPSGEPFNGSEALNTRECPCADLAMQGSCSRT